VIFFVRRVYHVPQATLLDNSKVSVSGIGQSRLHNYV
jgi:hypothetical protein